MEDLSFHYDKHLDCAAQEFSQSADASHNLLVLSTGYSWRSEGRLCPQQRLPDSSSSTLLGSMAVSGQCRCRGKLPTSVQAVNDSVQVDVIKTATGRSVCCLSDRRTIPYYDIYELSEA
jgi:hypothetical protein